MNLEEQNPKPNAAMQAEMQEDGNCGVQTLFRLDALAWAEFLRLLDEPPQELPALKKLLQSKPVWEV